MKPYFSILKSLNPSALALSLGIAIGVGFTPLANAQVFTIPPALSFGPSFTSYIGQGLTLNGTALLSPGDTLSSEKYLLGSTSIFSTTFPTSAGVTQLNPVALTWAQLQSDGVAGVGNYILVMQVTDVSNNTSTASATLSVLAVPPVPEPGEWLLILCGFGLLGFIASRRKIDL